MTRRWTLHLILLLILLPALWHPAAAQPQARVALVIGNGAYRGGIPPLANPPRDASAVARSLERLGFRVELLIDADRTTMLGAISRFGEAARGADAALLFYAGHAAEVGGQNLLFPISVSLASRANLGREAVSYEDVSAALNGKARVTLVLLDACRNNPLTGTEVPLPVARGRLSAAGAPTRSVGAGLATVTSAFNTLIAYATAPGQVALDGEGQNSPFTAALLRHLETPDVEVRDMLTRVRRTVRDNTGGRQVPWDNSSLDAPFFLRTASAPSISAGPTRRILAEAEAQGIPLPAGITEERFRRPAASSGPAALLVGSWSSGDQRWGGRAGRRNVLIVLSVDESRGTADTVFAQSEYSDEISPGRGPLSGPATGYFHRRVMSLGRGTATLEWTGLDGGQMKFILTSPDTLIATLQGGGARASNRGGPGIVRVQMRRID